MGIGDVIQGKSLALVILAAVVWSLYGNKEMTGCLITF